MLQMRCRSSGSRRTAGLGAGEGPMQQHQGAALVELTAESCGSTVSPVHVWQVKHDRWVSRRLCTAADLEGVPDS
jgi:hypothetical protein